MIMDKFKCNVCNHIYDPAKGDPSHDIEPNTPFEELPEKWLCPICSVDKSHFNAL